MMKTAFLLLFSLMLSLQLYATTRTVVSNNSTGWNFSANWSPSGIPQDGDTVFIPAGKTITIKGSIYAVSALIHLLVSGTLDFEPSGKLDLSLYSTVQIARGGSITSDNNNSEVIRINDITKYQGGVDESPLIGPLYASAATGISPSGFVAGTLPAHIKNFTAHKKQNEIWIGWSSAEETGVAYYDLQRSLDGISWMNLKTVAAKGPGSFYEEKDDKPLKGTNLYRLKMHGTNGTASYSGIVLSAFMMPLEILSAVHKGNLLQVQLSEAGTKPLLLQLIEPNGNIIRQSIQDPGSALLFPIDGVQQGIYILSVSDQAGHTTSKKLMLL